MILTDCNLCALTTDPIPRSAVSSTVTVCLVWFVKFESCTTTSNNDVTLGTVTCMFISPVVIAMFLSNEQFLIMTK